VRREVRDLWVAALRSGEFARTTGKLTRVDEEGRPYGYCCLGVLCEVAVRAGLELQVSDDVVLGARWYAGVDDFLPREVVDWADLPALDPLVTYDRMELSLSTVNDDYRPSFSAIATAIEELL